MADAEMLHRTMDRVLAHPEEHEQGAWRCKTGCCFAGHAALEAGGVWLTDVYGRGVDWDHRAYMIAVPEDKLRHTELVRVAREDGVVEEVRAIHVSARAGRVLGLDYHQRTRLFAGNNTPEMLKDLIGKFTA